MKKMILSLIAAFCFVMITNAKANAMGLFYTDTSYPVTATGASVSGDLAKLKHGSSTSLNVLFLIEIGDASIDTAAKGAHIRKINYIDINERSVLFFFKKITTTVYGE